MSGIRAFTLPPDQLARVHEAGGPLAQIDPANLANMRIAVVEVEGRIVAYWVTFYGLHVEPLWIAEGARKSPGVIRGVVSQMQTIVEESGEAAAFCVIEDGGTAALVASYADRLGFHEAPGTLYYLVRPLPAAPIGG